LIDRLTRTWAIIQKEFRQLRRDRLTFGMIVGIPLMQILFFGFAINTDVRHLRAGVADLAQTDRSRLLTAEAAASQVIDVVRQVDSVDGLEILMRRGEITVGIYIPRDFERRLLRGEPAVAQLLLDGGDPTVGAALSGLANLPAPSLNRTEPITARRAFELRPYYNPERRSAVHIVPGLIGVILQLTMALFTSVAIVRERERGTLELLITTPVSTLELMIGKIIPYIGIGIIQITLILGVGVYVFHVPVRGSTLDLYLASTWFIAATLALGLLISTFAKTQFQAMQLTFFTFLPSMLLSGFMFPFDGIPDPLKPFSEILPLTHFLRVVRGIILKGATLGEVRGELRALAIFFFIVMAVSILRFRKRLD
jgi:ABC-2 type transport system permease protein